MCNWGFVLEERGGFQEEREEKQEREQKETQQAVYVVGDKNFMTFDIFLR